MEKEEKKESKISKLIKRYPFNGRSNYLIDKFYIFGYNNPTLLKLLFEDNNDNLSKHIIIDKKQNEEEKSKTTLNVQSFHLKEEPILLNEFTSDFNKECLEINMIKDMILPNKLNLYFSEEELSLYNKENGEDIDNGEFVQYEEIDTFDNELLKPQTVVFSSNPQTENNSKKSINGFAYIFYKRLKKRKILSKKVISFYIPTIFSIISEFPFYNGFYKLCKQIKYLFSYPKKEVPIEIMLSNIINNTLSPINGDVILSIRPISFSIYENENKNEKNVIKSIPEVPNEDEEFTLITEKDLLDNDNPILRKQTSDNFIKKFAISSAMDIENNKAKRKFLKKKTQVIEYEPKNKINNETEKRLEHSPLTPRNNDDIMITERKKRKTYTEKAMNNLIAKSKKQGKNKTSKLYDNYLTEDLFPKIKFEFLKGYPLIQYNLAKVLLYSLSPSDIIEIFFYTFLEKDILFFSKNLQLLSLTINSYLNLNFPLNDEKYYFINASVSFDNYLNCNSPFVGSTFTTIIGINDQYQPKYINSQNKLKEHLVVDLDKGEIYKIDEKKNKESSKKNKEFFNLIKKICKKEIKNEKKQKTILVKEVSILNKKLNEIQSLLNNNENEIDDNEQFKLFKTGDFLDYDDDKNNYIKKTNIEIQDAFYRLINNLCLYFYQNLSIKTEDDDFKKNEIIENAKIRDKTEMNVIFRDDYKSEDEKDRTYIKEELFFLEELRETMKYESFVYGFVQSYSPIDLYKIPLTFTEEFLSIISRKRSILEKDFNFFRMFDQLYGSKIYQISQIDFNPFFSIYYKLYKDYFDREIEDFEEENILNEDLIKIKYCYDENRNKKYLNYRDYELDNNLLMKYLNIINNSEADDHNYMQYLSEVLKNNVPKKLLVIDIENLIENYSIETNLLSMSDVCCSNIIILFSLSLNFLDSNIDCQSFLGTLFYEFTVFRKYYSYIMNMIFMLFSDSLNKQNYSRANFYLMCYYICVNSMRSLKLVPNESLMNIMKKFNDIDSKKFHEKVAEHQNDNEIENNNNVGGNESKGIKREELTDKNFYTCYNFTKEHFIKEEEVINRINSKVNNNFSDIKKRKIGPKIKYNNISLKIESNFYSQTYMLSQLINIYNKYVVDLNEAHLGYKILVESCMNILIFMRNDKEFKDKEEIIDTVEIIFFLFLNKMIESK